MQTPTQGISDYEESGKYDNTKEINNASITGAKEINMYKLSDK